MQHSGDIKMQHPADIKNATSRGYRNETFSLGRLNSCLKKFRLFHRLKLTKYFLKSNHNGGKLIFKVLKENTETEESVVSPFSFHILKIYKG